MATKKLTAQQEQFCLNIVSGMNQADAYRKSYKVQPTTKNETIQANASRLMADSMVSARVAELRQPIISKVQLTREWVLEQLIESVAMGKATDPVIGKDGEHTGDLKQNLAAANKALELLGKELGMFVDKSKVEVASSVTLTLSNDDANI
jgi:hypothetical protein